MSGLLPLLVVLIFAACAPPEKAQEPQDPAGNLPEEGGFFETGDEKMPAPVRAASASVFRILVPTKERTQEVDTSFAMGSAYKLYLAAVEPDPMIRAVMTKQFEFCEKQQGFFNDKKQKCKIAVTFNKGSGFLMGNGKTLWTAAHVIENIFAAKDVSPVFVFDKDGNLFFDPYTETPKISRPHPTSSEPEVDYASLALTKEIGVPLKLSARAPVYNELVFAIGFPACTGKCDEPKKIYDRSGRLTGPDSTGKDQRISRGRPFLASKWPLVETTVDVMPGNSGGPGVNNNGEVFGIAILSGEYRFRLNRHRYGVFVAPPEWRR